MWLAAEVLEAMIACLGAKRSTSQERDCQLRSLRRVLLNEIRISDLDAADLCGWRRGIRSPSTMLRKTILGHRLGAAA